MLYHRTLLEATGNYVMRRIALDIRRRLQRITYHLAVEHAFMLADAHAHIAVAEAIQTGNRDQAAHLMGDHLDQVANKTLMLVHTYIMPIHGKRF